MVNVSGIFLISVLLQIASTTPVVERRQSGRDIQNACRGRCKSIIRDLGDVCKGM
jgi:hypothetical protein